MTLIRASIADTPILFQADSFSALSNLDVGDVEMEVGSPFYVEIQLNGPYGPAFDLPEAEGIFANEIPPGLELVDVRGEGWTTAIVECRVAAPTGAYAPGVFVLVALGMIVRFIASRWALLLLTSIGIALALNAITARVTGRGIISRVAGGILAGFARPLALGSAFLASGAAFLFGITRREGG